MTTDATYERQDDGYFGPDSVSWRVFADPSSKLGGVAALLLQALNPPMMVAFSKVSAGYADAQGRADRTARYIDTTIFGDKAQADAAGAAVQRLHAHATWTDERTGQEMRADTPEWLEWTHNTIVWGVLRAAELFGPELSTEEQDRLVVEQHEAARLVGVDPSRIPSTRAALDNYVNAQTDWLALSLPAAEVSASFRKPSFKGNPLKVWTGIIVQDGILAILPEWAQLMYGIHGRPMNLRSAAKTTRRMLAVARKNKPYGSMVDDLVSGVNSHPYRKVRSPKAAASS